MKKCPNCDAEYIQMYKLYIHCSREHPEIEFEFETVYIGRNQVPLAWPTKLKETTNGVQ